MAQKESQSGQFGKVSFFNQNSVEFAEMAKKRFEEFSGVQSELFQRFQEAGKQWLDRIQAEANFASEFASNLASARSIPDVLTACQECGARRFAMMADDAKHALDDMQKFMQTGARMLAN